MNSDQILGRLIQVKGRAKALAGNAVGNYWLQRDGRADQHSGSVQAAFGNARQATQIMIRELMHRIQLQS